MKHSQNENIYNILEKKEKKYKLLLDNMDDGFILNQAVKSKMGEIVDFRIAEVNPAFEKLTNTEWDDIGNKSLITICPDEHNQKKMVQAGKDALNRGSHQEEHFFPGINKYFRIFYFAYEDDYLAMLFQDISQLKQDIETQSFIASIVESSDDAIFRESPEGKILSWNEGAMNLYGYTPQEAIGKTASELYCYPKNDGDNDLIEQAGKGKKVKNHETVHRRKDGSTVHVSITKSPIINSKGCVVGIANIAKDITLVKQREAELIKAKEVTEQAANLKSAFLANMSHEIRTPLNAILGFTNLLNEYSTNENQKKYIRIIYHSGKQLLNLINDIVDVSRIEAGEMPIFIKNVHLKHLMEQIQNQFEGYNNSAQKEEIAFSLSIPKELHNLYIKTDPTRLEQILINLLSNAFKFTEKGKVEFGFNLQDENTLLFYVKDTGRGIKLEHQELIFDRFKQGDHLSIQVIKGTGLGLAISRGLCQLLGGKIWVESMDNHGSTFYFTHPVEAGIGEPLEISRDEDEKYDIPNLSGKNILVAEDDPFSLEMIVFFLEATKATVFVAEDGEKAVDMFRKNHIDIVLLDIRLPKINGYEVLKIIKNTDAAIPVIAQTAYAMQEEIQHSKNKGFNHYLTKPIIKKNLYKILSAYR